MEMKGRLLVIFLCAGSTAVIIYKATDTDCYTTDH